MTRLADALTQIGGLLDELKADWALVGGLAVSVRAVPRFTRDIDLVVAVSDDGDAERVVYALSNLGYTIRTVIEQDATNRLATARLSPPGESQEGVLVDLLFASSGIESEIAAGADRVEVFTGVEIPVATQAHLLAMKVLSNDALRRPQDSADIRALLQVCSDDDLAAALRALELITSRGFHRERDLRRDLDQVIAAGSGAGGGTSS